MTTGIFPRNSIRLGLWLVCITLICVLVSGCAAKIKTDPFKAYADANRKLQDSADDSLKMAYDCSVSSFSRRVQISKDTVLGLMLTQDKNDPFGWKAPDNDKEALPLKFAALRDGVNRLNKSLVQYADLLMQLASDELVSSKQFEQMAGDLNSGVRSAFSSIGKSPRDSKAALFSAAAMTAAQQYIESKRRSHLVEALRSNQTEIESAASLGKEAARIMAQPIVKEYNDESAELVRKPAVEPLLKLDERYIAQLQVLRSLHDAYDQLPVAHQQLSASLESEGSHLGQIQALYDNAMRIQHLYADLKKTK
jgi:hypothetical protein